jgi:hypothetical protein
VLLQKLGWTNERRAQMSERIALDKKASKTGRTMLTLAGDFKLIFDDDGKPVGLIAGDVPYFVVPVGSEPSKS